MGGMGFIEANKTLCFLSVLIKHSPAFFRAMPASNASVSLLACVCNANEQKEANLIPSWKKTPTPCLQTTVVAGRNYSVTGQTIHLEDDLHLRSRVARFHNIYGPLGSSYGGRAEAQLPFAAR